MDHQKTLSAKWLLPLLFFFLLIHLSKANALILNVGITNDSSTAKAWSTPTALAKSTLDFDYFRVTDLYKNGESPRVITNKNGKAFAVWREYHSVSFVSQPYMVYTHWSAYFDGQNWSNPIKMKGFSPIAGATIPEIIFDGNGNILAAWSESTNDHPYSQNIIFTSRFDSQNLDWDNPIQLTFDNDNEGISNLQLTYRNNNEIHIVYNHKWSSVFNGISWSNPTQLENPNWLELIFNNDNNDIIGWTYEVPAQNHIALTTSHFNGNNWSTPQLLLTAERPPPLPRSYEMAVRPKTAFNKNGNAITVWTDVYQQNQILASYFNRSSRSWSAPVPVSELGYPDHAQLAINSHGNAIAVWKEKEQLWANHFNGSNWGTPAPIGTIGSSGSFQNHGDQATNNNIAFDDNNHAHVVWVQTVDGNSNVWANSFDGNRWGTATPIENTNKEINDIVRVGTSLKQSREPGPQYVTISIDTNGNAHAIWERTISTSVRERFPTRVKTTKTKTIWTSQLKASPPIMIQQAFVYMPYGGFVVVTGANFMEYNEVTNKLVDQDGNSPLAIYVWRGDMVVAIFRDVPESVTMTNPNGTKVISLHKYY